MKSCTQKLLWCTYRQHKELFTVIGKESTTIRLEIEGKFINILIDSDSLINAIDKQTFDLLNSSQFFHKTNTNPLNL
jgi:hypothetical protein